MPSYIHTDQSWIGSNERKCPRFKPEWPFIGLDLRDIHGEACYSLDQQRRHQICGGATDIRLRAFAFLLLSENNPSDVSTRPRMFRLKSAGWLRVVPVHIMFPTSQRFINSHTDYLRTFLKMIKIEWLRVGTDWSVYRYARVGNEFCLLLQPFARVQAKLPHLRFETEAGLRMHRCEVALRVSRAMKTKLKIALQVGYESMSED